MSWFFACCWKFRKANSYFNDFWVDMVKNRHGHLIHEILKSAEWFYELSSFFACWLWCNNFWLDQQSYSISLTFKCQSTAIVLVRPLAVAGNPFSLSILSSRHLSGCVHGIGSLDFSAFWHGARNPYEVVLDSMIYWKNFCPKNSGNEQKIGFFLDLKKNLVINFH